MSQLKKIFKQPKKAIAAGLLLALVVGSTVQFITKPTKIPWPEFREALSQKTISDPSLTYQASSGMILVHAKKAGKKIVSEVLPVYEQDLNQIFTESGFPSLPQKTKSSFPWIILPQLLLFGLLGFFIWKSFKKFTPLKPEDNPITFQDVAGIGEAKEEVTDLVNYLHEKETYQSLGGQIPKGVLLIGPPGCGKTYLARAIANEAGVPFYYAAGSDFTEMFAGLGAARIRQLFKQVRKLPAAVLFIDEIDSVGAVRSNNQDAASRDHSQTVNALLVAMDGILPTEGLIVIAATNRKDTLDPALLRPGRFDREIHIQLPDIKGREAILERHGRKVKLDKQEDLKVIAGSTAGFSGAELANVINEAALKAAKEGHHAVLLPDLEYAREKVKWGLSRTGMSISETQRNIVAVHEAGHAIASLYLKHIDPLHKVTIIPRGESLGATMMIPDEDKYLLSEKTLKDHLCLLFAGRAAELEFFNDITNGAAGDLQAATKIAREMTYRWGMRDSMEFIEAGKEKDFSKTEHVDAILKEAFEEAKNLIRIYRTKVEVLSKALLKRETMTAEEVNQVLQDN